MTRRDTGRSAREAAGRKRMEVEYELDPLLASLVVVRARLDQINLERRLVDW
jgi:hypothetical protein